MSHNLTINDEPERSGGPVFWLALIWAGMVFGVALCLIVVIAAGGGM